MFLPTLKISPIIPQVTPLDHEFACKNPKFSRCVDFNGIYIDRPQGEHQNPFPRLFKRLKYSKKIQSNPPALPASKIRYLAKKVHRSKIINLDLTECLALHSSTSLSPWIKYIRNLEFLSLLCPEKKLISYTFHTFFGKQLEECLGWFPHHKNLKDVQIKLLRGGAISQRALFPFLELNEEKPTFPEIFTRAFSRLKKIEGLSLSGRIPGNIILLLLKIVPKLGNLRKLDIQNLQKPFGDPSFSLNACKMLENLSCLKVSDIDESKNLDILDWTPQLDTFDISGEIGSQGLAIISQILSKSKNSLTSLKIRVIYNYHIQIHEKIKDLFKRIQHLEALTSFEFKFQEAEESGAKFYSELVENLEGLFPKGVKLRSFVWEFSQASGPENFTALLKLVESSKSTLKKLKIIHPLMSLDKSQKAFVLNFLKGLESIEFLYLSGLNVKEDNLWAEIVDVFIGLKSLRFLGIGCIDKTVKNGWWRPSLTKLGKNSILRDLYIETFERPEGDTRWNDRMVMVTRIWL